MRNVVGETVTRDKIDGITVVSNLVRHPHPPDIGDKMDIQYY